MQAPSTKREVASLTLLALCSLRTAYPRHWRSMLVRAGLRDDWQEDYVGSKRGAKRKIAPHTPRMFRCAIGPHWVAYEEDVQGELQQAFCHARGTQEQRKGSPEYQYCRKHMRVHARPAKFTTAYMLAFEAREHEYRGYIVDPRHDTITHYWKFDEPRTGLQDATSLNTISYSNLKVVFLCEGPFIFFRRW